MEIAWSIPGRGFPFKSTVTQTTTLTKYIPCQSYVKNLIPNLFISVVPLTQHSDYHSDSRRCNTERSCNPGYYLQSTADGNAKSVSQKLQWVHPNLDMMDLVNSRSPYSQLSGFCRPQSYPPQTPPCSWKSLNLSSFSLQGSFSIFTFLVPLSNLLYNKPHLLLVACQVLIQSKISCKEELPVLLLLSFLMMSRVCWLWDCC